MLLPLIGLIVLAKIPAWDAAPAGGKLVVIDDKFLTVSGFDPATGKRAWTSKVIQKAKGRHTLHVVGSTVLAWFGETLSSIDPATGKVSALGKRGYNGVAWEDGGCWLDFEEGVAAQRCQCSFQLFDPATNKDIGPRYQKTYVHIEELDANGGRGGRSSAGCWGMSETLFGRAGNLALITAEDASGKGRGKMRGPTITAAIDLTTGTEAWRLAQHSQFGGHSLDNKTCWFYGFTEAIVAVDCATGKKLWTGTKLPAMGRHDVTYVPASPGPKGAKGGVLDLRAPTNAPGEASLHDERTGMVRWTTKLAPDTLAWVKGAPPEVRFAAYEVTSVAILDQATGKPIATIPKPDAGIVFDKRGGFALTTKTDLIAYDTSGKETARSRLGGAGIYFGESLVVAKLETELVVFDRATLHERGRLPGDFSVVHVEGDLGVNRIAAYAYDGKTIGSVTLISVR